MRHSRHFKPLLALLLASSTLILAACGGGFEEDFIEDEPIDEGASEPDTAAPPAGTAGMTPDEFDQALADFLGYDDIDQMYDDYLNTLSDEEFDQIAAEALGISLDELYDLYDAMAAEEEGAVDSGGAAPSGGGLPPAPTPEGGFTATMDDLRMVDLGSMESGDTISLTINPGDISFLLNARTADPEENVYIDDLIGPNGPIYTYDQDSGETQGLIDEGFFGAGEATAYMPWLPKLALVPGTYDFVIATETGSPIEAVYAVVRSGDPTVPMALDLNFFVLTEYSALADPAAQAAAEAIIRGEIDRIINGYNLRLGNVRWAVGTPDQIADFSTVDDSANSGQEVRNGCLAAKVVFGVDHRAVNIIIVDSIVSVEEGIGPGETLGVAVGVPGSFMTPGSGYDCVYTSLDGNYDFTANEFSQTTVHEFGHMLGLQHTTEQDGLFFDRFGDTPECDANTYDSDGDGELITDECLDADGGNLMFWEGIQLALSPDQIFVISRHPAFYPVQ